MGNCYICGASIDELQIDPRDKKTMPCGVCLDEVDKILDYWNEDSVYSYVEDDPSDLVVEEEVDDG